MRWLVLLAVAAVGCGQVDLPLDKAKLVDGPADADRARLMVCADFGISNCPTVYWNGPEALDCDGGTGFLLDDGTCVAGVQGANGILIAYPYEMKPSDAPLTHECGHWKWDDHDHSNPAIWGQGTDIWGNMLLPGNRVGDANIALIAAGL